MKRPLFIIVVLFYLKSSNAQIIQNFEGPLPVNWVGNGVIMGGQGGNLNPHGGGSMYQLSYADHLTASMGLPSVTKYIGIWVYKTHPSAILNIWLNDYTTGATILNIGSFTAFTSGYWSYAEYQLGVGYSGNYNVEFSHYFNFPTAYPPIYIDDIIFDTQSHIVSVEEVLLNDFKIYPNPSTNGKFNITFRKSMDKINIELFDLTGKLVYSESSNVFANENREINTDILLKGMYICKISNTTSSYCVQKLVIE